MARYEVSRTLVKSPPELWEELCPERLSKVAGDVTVETTEPEKAIAWEGGGVRGTAVLEPAGWGTKVTLTAEVEEQVARHGFWMKLRGYQPPPATHQSLEGKLNEVLDDLGAAHKRPFSREG
jgi:hypothetical protein